MNTCDARGCPARATREISYDSGSTLHACSHHAAEWLPWLTPDMRFTADHLNVYA